MQENIGPVILKILSFSLERSRAHTHSHARMHPLARTHTRICTHALAHCCGQAAQAVSVSLSQRCLKAENVNLSREERQETGAKKYDRVKLEC